VTRALLWTLAVALGCGGSDGEEGEGEAPACDLLAQDCAEGEGCFVEPGGEPYCAKAGDLPIAEFCGDKQTLCAEGFYCTPENLACCPFCADGAPDTACPQDPFEHVCCPRDDLPEGVSLCLPKTRGCKE